MILFFEMGALQLIIIVLAHFEWYHSGGSFWKEVWEKDMDELCRYRGASGEVMCHDDACSPYWSICAFL